MRFCSQCGKPNSDGALFCEACGQPLGKSREQEEKERRLKDYWTYKKRNSMSAILITLLVLLLMIPFMYWMFGLILGGEAGMIADIAKKYAPILVVLLLFFAAVLPMIVSRMKLGRKYRWSKEQKQALDQELKTIPAEFFIPTEQANAAKKPGASAAVPLVIIVLCAGLVFLNEFTEVKPLSSIASLIGIGQAKQVSGRYECHLSAANMGGGVARVEQTWAYVFRSDGTYTTYLNGYQQFSGTWSQSGSTLSIRVPAIPNISAATTSQAKVSMDGSSFTAGENTFVRKT